MHKYLRSFSWLPFFFLIFQFSALNLSAQNSYSMILANGQKTGAKTFEFDVLISGQGPAFELTSYQAALTFDSSFSGNLISFSYIENTSELDNIPSTGIGINNTDGNFKLTFASMPGSDNITNEQKWVGRFRVESSVVLNSIPAVNWNFTGSITTILTGNLFLNITNPSGHITYLGPTGVSSGGNEISGYELYQNYPNPFNPETSIRFNLPEDGKVKLAVFNILGEQVAELINGEIPQGAHEISFSGSSLASGVYLYRLDIENSFSDIKKMILMK
jgi:hypothetical protein